MVTFTRQKADNWHREVPGARWFKADLHIHTIDDHPGRRAKLPAGINGPPQSPKTISDYARRFLQSAVEHGVRVLGITPHSPRIAADADTSAVWRIVEEWNSGCDDDGIPFREKIYAVFPGFEPSLKEGQSGLHLLFLFDPEIGRDDYLKAFDLVMGGRSPWPADGNELRISSRDAEEAFEELRNLHLECPKDSDGGFQWSYITLAPHIDGKKGLFGAQKAQVLGLFQFGEVAGLELGDQKLVEDTVKNRPWLRDTMEEHRQAFYHSTDAYSVDEIGNRHTWLKLANPRIEALRQAFIASDSRIRIGYERDANGGLTEIPNPPDVTMNQRPWLRSVTVSGEASFFGGSGGKPGSRFDLSPDLTCIIGGSMTGKSTLLDGLRMYVGAPLPENSDLKGVEERGRHRFLAGSPEVKLDCPGQDTTATPHEQWPAEFYAQNELQQLAKTPESVEDILARLVASEKQGIEDREKRLRGLDEELKGAAKRLAELGDKLADSEQAFERSQKAVEEIAAFSDAGVEKLNRISSDLRRWQQSAKAAIELAGDLDSVLDSLGAVDLPEIDDSLADVLRDKSVADRETDFRARWDRIRHFIRFAKDELGAANTVTGSIVDALESHERGVRVEVDRELATHGLDGARISQLQALNVQASLLKSYEANFNDVRDRLASAEGSFEKLLSDRKRLVKEQRRAFDRVIEMVHSQFDGRIAARRIDNGGYEPLDQFLRRLNQRGITRWWNDLKDKDEDRPTPQVLLEKLKADQLDHVGMSLAVQNTFRESIGRLKQYEIAAIRCRDLYSLEHKVDDGSYRSLDDLSGGQRVNLLLSLLLETKDERPLVIDQPEDELDNRFLFETMLPALKRLKGHRQIIVATHNANIVVNGDADLVIQLEANANRGRVELAGAIEDPDVRDAIVRTVDGGGEAFRLRQMKYGF